MAFADSLRAVVKDVRLGRTSWGDVSLGVRMLAWAVALRLLKHLVTLPRLARLMRPRLVARAHDPILERRVAALARTAAGLAGGTSDANCYTRSLLTYRFVGLAGTPAHLVVGFDRGETGVRGHAWVESGGRPVGEPPDAVSAFEPFVRFDERAGECRLPGGAESGRLQETPEGNGREGEGREGRGREGEAR